MHCNLRKLKYSSGCNKTRLHFNSNFVLIVEHLTLCVQAHENLAIKCNMKMKNLFRFQLNMKYSTINLLSSFISMRIPSAFTFLITTKTSIHHYNDTLRAMQYFGMSSHDIVYGEIYHQKIYPCDFNGERGRMTPLPPKPVYSLVSF